MRLRQLALSILLAALPSLPAAAASPARKPVPVIQGDADHGAGLFRLHCAACHGAGARGDGPLAKSLTAPKPADLRDPALLLQRGDEGLVETIARGGPGRAMRAFEGVLDPLDGWDLVAFLRRGQPTITDFFPDTVRYTAKTYVLDAKSQARVEQLLGKLSAAEAQVAIAAAFGGPQTAQGPVFVPQTPRDLDTLKPRRKLGYVAFVSLKTPWASEPVPMALSFDREGFIQSARPELGRFSKAQQQRAAKVLDAFTGYGGKAADYEEFKAPKVEAGQAAEAAALAKAFTRAYYRALQGALMFDKEEADRNWAD